MVFGMNVEPRERAAGSSYLEENIPATENELPLFASESSISLIERAREEILEMTTALCTQSDPYLEMRSSLLPLLCYEPTTCLLYIKQGKLDYYYPLSPFGAYAYGEEVAGYIKSQVEGLKKYMSEQPDADRWKSLRLANECAAGLARMVQDYSRSSTYEDFHAALSAIEKDLAEMIETARLSLNKSVDELSDSSSHSPFDLWELPAESYPLEMVESALLRFFGPRLCAFAKEHFLVKNSGGRIAKEALRDALIAVAANVKQPDIDWLFERIEIQNPSEGDWCEALDYFRKAKGREDLLDYFEMPRLRETFDIDWKAIADRPFLSPTSPYAKCEASVLADIESSSFWHPKEWISMGEREMYDQLNTLFQNPYEPQLFHTDRYLSFLAAASTALAYVRSCKGVSEEIEHKIVPLIELLQSIVDRAEEMYPPKFVEQYKMEWETLIAQLKQSLWNSHQEYSNYYRTLFTYPGSTPLEKQKLREAHLALQPSEYLARKVGYWNRYYLSSEEFVDHKGRLKDAGMAANREGTLFYLSNGERLVPYAVKSVEIDDGYVCQICMPLFVGEAKKIPIKVVYQGTIGNGLSEKRDASPKGPGVGLWREKGAALFDRLIAIMRETQASADKELAFDIEFTGHSLGGADAQNGAAAFSELLLQQGEVRAMVGKIDVHTFNPAGITTSSDDQFNANRLQMIDLFGSIRHSMAKNDIVERSGQARLGANLSDPSRVEIMEISNLGVYHIVTNHCLYGHAISGMPLPHKLLDPEKDADARHRYLFGAMHSWSDLKGHANDMIESCPIAKVAFNSLYLVSLCFGARQLHQIEKSLSHHRVLDLAAAPYLEEKMRGSIKNIWEGFTHKWEGVQTLG